MVGDELTGRESQGSDREMVQRQVVQVLRLLQKEKKKKKHNKTFLKMAQFSLSFLHRKNLRQMDVNRKQVTTL